MTKSLWKQFWQEDSGQTTTEYVLILAVVVTMIMQFKNQFKGIMTRLFGRLDEEISSDELFQ